jgi:hypothetical protein
MELDARLGRRSAGWTLAAGYRRALLLLLAALPALRADVCASKDFIGPYGFILSGIAAISDREQPSASVGRIVLDGSGKLSGSSSVNFNGYFLGNPVTGTYEVQTDCAITWALQDDSGAFQHFTGRAAPNASKVEFHQSDPGTDRLRGTLEKLPGECAAAGFQGRYRFTLDGFTSPFAESSTHKTSAEGVAEADGAGNLVLSEGADRITGTYDVDGDCFVEIAYNGAKLRGILVNGGKTVLVIETDPKTTAAGRFSSQ